MPSSHRERRFVSSLAPALTAKQILSQRKKFVEGFDQIKFPAVRVRRVVRVVQADELPNGDFIGHYQGYVVQFKDQSKTVYEIEADGYGIGQTIYIKIKNRQIGYLSITRPGDWEGVDD